MKHPFARLFAPISMIIAIAFASVATALTGPVGFDSSGTPPIESVGINTVVAVQDVTEMP